MKEGFANSWTGLRTHLLAILSLILIVVVLFWPVFWKGETLIDLAAQSNQLPWGANSTTYDGYAYNRRDLTDTYVTRDYFVAASYQQKELPLWNPYILSGQPMYADGVTKLFSPTLLLYKFFSVPAGYSLGRLLELMFLGIFTYIFLINLNLNPLAAFTGSLTFMLSDHVMQHLTWLGWLGGLMCLPLMLLGADQAVRRQRTLPAIGAGLALALHFYFGYMPTAIYYLGALVIYYLSSPGFINAQVDWFTSLKKALGYLVVTLVVGFGLSAPIWLPIFELLSYSNRKIVPTEIGYTWLPPGHLLTIILPRIFGSAFDGKFARRFVEVGVSQDHSIYVGLVTLLFIGLAVWAVRRKLADRRIYYFVGLIVLAIFVMVGAPVYTYFTKYLPVLKTIRAVTRISGLYTFSAAVVAAYGVDALGRLAQSHAELLLGFWQRAKYTIITLLISILATSLLFNLIGRYLPQDLEAGGRLRRWTLKILVSFSEQLHWQNREFLIPLGIMVVLGLLIYVAQSTTLPVKPLTFLLIGLLSIDLIWQGSQYNATFSSAAIFPVTGATDFLQRNLGNYRVVVAPAEFGNKAETSSGHKIVAPPNTLLPYKIATISGKDQLFPKGYRELTSLVEPQNYLSHIVFKRTYAPLYDLLGVKYLISRDVNEVTESNYQPVYRGEGVRIYENHTVMPRVFFAPAWEVVPTAADALARMKQPDFDLHKQVVVQSRPKLLQNVAPADSQELLKISHYNNNYVAINTATKAKHLLVLSDTYYPGWVVTINGQPAELLVVDYLLRGVVVPEGEHLIEFTFRPKSLQRGVIISLITLVVSLIAAIIWRKK